MNFTDNEPAITAGGITALVSALIALGAAFGMPITDAQKTAILSLVAIVAPIAVGLVVRGFVTPTKKLTTDAPAPSEASQSSAQTDST